MQSMQARSMSNDGELSAVGFRAGAWGVDKWRRTRELAQVRTSTPDLDGWTLIATASQLHPPKFPRRLPDSHHRDKLHQSVV